MHPDWCVSEKSKITPHKGGRKQIGVMATPADIDRAKALGISYGDIFLAGLDALEKESDDVGK